MRNKNITYMSNYGVITHPGNVRKSNEDSICANPETGLFLVADGMGGHRCGALASTIAKDVINESIIAGKDLTEAIRASHHKILLTAEENSNFHGMGSTVVAVLLDGIDYVVAWIGDSRVYLWDGNLIQLTQDHSYVRSLLDEGVITEDEAEIHPSRHLITRCLGVNDQDGDLDVDFLKFKFAQGQELLLCSDGLTDELSDAEIAQILSEKTSTQDRADNLVESALEKGGRDNISAILLSAPEISSGKSTFVKSADLKKKINFLMIGALIALSLLVIIAFIKI